MSNSKFTTSTGYRYDKSVFEKSAMKFPTLSQLSSKATFGIPGLDHTAVDEGLCECMTPQGICVAGPYVLITAYCNIRKYLDELEKHAETGDNPARLKAAKEHVQHKSVIYVVDKVTTEHIATVALPDCNHVGGITYDGTYVWVAKDTDQKMSAILFSELDRVIKYGLKTIRYITTTKIHCNAIFTITHKDRIWVGNSYSKKTGTMVCFRVKNILGIPRLVKEGEIEMPILAQGAMLVDAADLAASNNSSTSPATSEAVNSESTTTAIPQTTFLAISVSGGRVNPSKVYRYKVDLSKVKKGSVLKLADCEDFGAMELPPMMEEITMDPETNAVYTQFESASSPYSAVEGNPCKSIVDRVCISTLTDWFPEAAE